MITSPSVRPCRRCVCHRGDTRNVNVATPQPTSTNYAGVTPAAVGRAPDALPHSCRSATLRPGAGGDLGLGKPCSPRPGLGCTVRQCALR